MALPTSAQIDAAVPTAGTPSRSLTNAVLKNLLSGINVGTYDISQAPGVTTGVLASSPARQANGVALQTAFNYCATNGLMPIDLAGSRFEYEATQVQSSRNVGLQLPYNCPGFIGAGCGIKATTFVQYAVNHPAITLGDAGPSTAQFTQGGHYYGFIAGHGVSQAGQTSADGVYFGNHFGSDFDQIYASPFLGGGHAYIGMRFGDGTSQFFFSNRVGTIICKSGQVNLVRAPCNGTGNFFENVYTGTGTFGSRISLSGNAIWMGVNGLQLGTFGQLNAEWCSVGANLPVLRFDGDVVINNLHLEGNQLNGFNPGLVHSVVSRVVIGNAGFLDNWISATNASGTPRLFSMYSDARIQAQNVFARWQGSGVNAEAVASMSFVLFGDDTTLVGRRPYLQIENFDIAGNTGAFNPDAIIGTASWLSGGTLSRFSSYNVETVQMPRMSGATIVLPSGVGTNTVYGIHENMQVQLNTAISADRKTLLSTNLTSTGQGSTAARRPGDTINFHRTGNATGAFNWLIRDAGDTTTLATLSAVSTQATLTWTGSAWA